MVDYNKEVTTTIPASGTGMVPLPALEQAIDERYLSIKERETIRDMLQTGTSQQEIAKALGRSPSTISREIARTATRSAGTNRTRPTGLQPHAGLGPKTANWQSKDSCANT